MGFSIQIYAIFSYSAIFYLNILLVGEKMPIFASIILKAIHNKDYSVVKTLRF